MSYRNDFLEGMGSVYDLKGERHFNEFKNYPYPNGVIRNTWYNVGCHIDNAVSKLGQNNGLNSNPFRRRSIFEKL